MQQDTWTIDKGGHHRRNGKRVKDGVLPPEATVEMITETITKVSDGQEVQEVKLVEIQPIKTNIMASVEAQVEYSQKTDSKPAPKKSKAHKMMIVPVIKRRSGYQYEGTNSFLDTTRRTWIPNTDTIQLTEDVKGVGEKGERVEIRYIRGSSPYKALQEKSNAKFAPDRDVLFIEDGFKTVSDTGLEKSVYDYLELVNYNEDNPNRLTDVGTIFKVFSEEADAAAYINMDEKLFRAKQVVYALKNGENFNHDALKFYQRVFGLAGKEDVEIFKSFTLLANSNPTLVIEGIEKEQAGFLEIITRAFEQNLIVMDEAGVISTRRKKYIINTDNQVSRAIAEEKLLDFFSSERGTIEYHALKNEVGEFADREV